MMLHRQRLIRSFWKKIIAWIAVLSFSTLVEFDYVYGLHRLSFVNDCMDIGAVIISIVTVLILIVLCVDHQYRMSPVCFAIVGMYLFIGTVTLVNGYSVFKRGFLANIAMSILFDIIIYRRDTKFFTSLLQALNVMTFLNFISLIVLFHQHGFVYAGPGRLHHNYYLLSYDNGHIVTFFPVICFNAMIYIRTRRLRYLFYPFVCLVSVLIMFSATSIVMLSLMLIIFLLCRYFHSIERIFFNRWMVMASIVIIGWLYLFNGLNQLSDITIYLFQKSLESAGRIRMRDTALSYILKKPLLGYGYVTNATWINGYNSAHNFILNYLLTGGLIGLVLFVIIIYMLLRKGEESLNHREFLVPFSGVIAFLLASFAEGYDTYVTYYLFWAVCIAMYRSDSFYAMLDDYVKRPNRIIIHL